MNQVRFFLVKFILLLTIIAGIVGMTIILIPPDPGNFFQSSVNKLYLLKNTPSPRIILVGGSNVAFGIDSELLESRLGLPVVNLGLHGGIGESTYKELSDYIRAGDIILLMSEYVMFRSADYLKGSDIAIAQWIEYDLTRLRFLNPSRVPTLILTVAQVKAQRQLAYLVTNGDLDRGVFISENFNDHGDFIGHLNDIEQTKKLEDDPYFTSGDYYLESYQFFEQFNLDAKKKGAIVYFEFPASRDINCLATGKERLLEFYTTMLEWTTIPVLTARDEICYPNSYFYDTHYHLNAVGRRVMTERIIKDLIPLLP